MALSSPIVRDLLAPGPRVAEMGAQRSPRFESVAPEARVRWRSSLIPLILLRDGAVSVGGRLCAARQVQGRFPQATQQ